MSCVVSTHIVCQASVKTCSADCISYTILVSLPLGLLWNVNLPPNKRRVILVLFSSSIIVMMVSVFRAVSQMKGLWSLVGVATDLEVCFMEESIEF